MRKQPQEQRALKKARRNAAKLKYDARREFHLVGVRNALESKPPRQHLPPVAQKSLRSHLELRDARAAANPEVALERAAAPLTRVNLRTLLGISALLSFEDACTEGIPWVEHSAFLPEINVVNTQHFSRAVLVSQSTYTGTHTLSTLGVFQTLDALLPVQNLGSGLTRTVSGMSLEEVNTHLIGPHIKHQHTLDARFFLDRIVRKWLLLEVLPRKYDAELRSRLGGKYIDIRATYNDRHGLTTAQIMVGGANIWQAMVHILGAQFAPKSQRSQHWDVKFNPSEHDPERIRALENHLNQSLPNVQRFEIPHDDLVSLSGLGVRKIGESWVNLCTATIGEVRDHLEREPFNIGPVAYRPLPLERYPLVTLPAYPGEQRPHYILPNARSFLRGLPELPERIVAQHWTKDEQDRFNQVYGLAQEFYLRELLTTVLPTYTTIPETIYARPNNPAQRSVQSADLTIIDPVANGVIAVEAKGTRFNAYARTESGVSAFQGIGGRTGEFTKAVQKADWKLDDVLDPDCTAFDPHRAEIAQVNPTRRLTVILHAETWPMSRESWRALIDADASHPLHGSKILFVMLSLEEFEWFVEVSAKRQESLYDLLSVLQQNFQGFSGFGHIGLGLVDQDRSRGGTFLASWLEKLRTEYPSLETKSAARFQPREDVEESRR